MQSDLYYANRDAIINELNETCQEMHIEGREPLNQLTHEIIYAVNKWREKNGLPRYKEVYVRPVGVSDNFFEEESEEAKPITYELDGAKFLKREDYEKAFMEKTIKENPNWFKKGVVLAIFTRIAKACPECKSVDVIGHFHETESGWTHTLCLDCECRY